MRSINFAIYRVEPAKSLPRCEMHLIGVAAHLPIQSVLMTYIV